MIKTILFDLDGTLLPMDSDTFIQDYLGRMAKYMAPHGYDPKLLLNSLWAAIGAVIANKSQKTNEELFWDVFSAHFGRDCRMDEPLFREFYLTEFQKVKDSCGFDPDAAMAIRDIRDMGYEVVLATNPLFPAVATLSRVKWAGLAPEDFRLITTYENSWHCKPNPEYYRDILATLDLNAEECLMVGNDVGEDMIAEELGMKVFLLPACLINKSGKDITAYPQGNFSDLLTFIRGL